MRALLPLAVAGALLVAGPAAAQAPPSTIALPPGFQPEGVAAGAKSQLYVGSLADGAIWSGSARTGNGGILAQGQPGRTAVGIEVAYGKIFVAGGATGKIRVQDAATGADIAEWQVATPNETFINDVAVTSYAAWFTDSRNGVLYALPIDAQSAPVTVPLTGDFKLVPGFNLNGIAIIGSTLVAVQSVTGKLFSIDPRSGATREVDLGGATLENGDGLFQRRRTLYVVQNRSNKVATVQLAPGPGVTSGRIVRTTGDADFDVPTTIAPAAGWMWAVNARFDTTPTLATEYAIVRTSIRDRQSAVGKAPKR